MAATLNSVRNRVGDYECDMDAERDDVYLPTPEEIRAACREIQDGWTESERARRARGQAGRVRTSTVTTRRFARLLFEFSDGDERAA